MERSVHFFSRCDERKLTSLTAKLHKDPIEPLREIVWISYGIMVFEEHSSFGAVKKCW